MATQTYVTFLYPGAFFSEQSSEKVANRDIPKKIPENAFAFYFWDREEQQSGGELLKGEPKNHSKRFYINGQTFTVDELKAKYPQHSVLIRNIEYTENKTAVLCNAGNWQPFDKGDQIVKL